MPACVLIKLEIFKHNLAFLLASDRAMQGAALADCREALINAVVDPFASYQRTLGQPGPTLRMPPEGGLQYMPIYVLGLLKNVDIYYIYIYKIIVKSDVQNLLYSLMFRKRSAGLIVPLWMSELRPF